MSDCESEDRKRLTERVQAAEIWANGLELQRRAQRQMKEASESYETAQAFMFKAQRYYQMGRWMCIVLFVICAINLALLTRNIWLGWLQ